MAASKQPVKLVDPTTDANELAITARGSAEIEGTVADGATAAGVQPVIIGGVDSGGDAQNLNVNTDGSINVTLAAGGTSNVEFGTTASLAAAASADIDTADIAASTTTLKQITVAGEQPFFFTVSKVENAVATIVTGEMHGDAGSSIHYIPQVDLASTGGAAGLDAWRVSITNNDNNKASTFSATIEHVT